jgi:hypothetical protein
MSLRIGVDRRVLWIMVTLALTICASSMTVSSAQAEGTCPNEQLRAEQPYGLELPDCRAYEMVSPLYKDDNNIGETNIVASASGGAVTYISKGSFAEARASRFQNRYISRRGQNGWSTLDLTPPYSSDETNTNVPFEELMFTSDLSKGLLRGELTPLTSDSPSGYINLYIADTSSNTYQAVTTGVPPGLRPYEQQESEFEPRTVGFSSDLSHVVFQEYGFEGLTPEASPDHTHVYEWSGGHLVLVDVAPEGKTLSAEDRAGSPGSNPRSGDVWHAVSSDGSRVFFTGGEGEGGKTGGQVYVRETNDVRTVEVSASQKTNGSGPSGTDPNGPKPARYWDANAGGSKVFFTSSSELTNDANTGPADNAANLYEYDLETGLLTDLTVDVNAGDVNGAAVLGLVNAGEDGAYVYFVAEGRLAAGAVSEQPNLYLYHDGKVGYITTLGKAGERSGGGEERGGDSEDWGGSEQGERGPGAHTARVTPDGTRLAFESELSLTGYNNVPVEPENCRGFAEGKFGPRPCKEVYLYDVRTGLTCVSCDPDGSAPVGPARLGGHEELAEGALASPSPFYLPRNLSGEGMTDRLFFESPDPLVVHDSNGRQDVYEYEDGHVNPISNVAGNFESFFLEADSSGNNVFIGTADQLLPEDEDQRIDIYDVKTVGGFPVLARLPVCNNGDSCKPPVSPQPGIFGAPASATFSGAGNVVPTPAVKATVKPKIKAKAKAKRCKKGFLSKRGKCVKKAKRSGAHSKKGRQ